MQFASLATRSLNLGDEIQRLAADRFLPRIDTVLDRERLHEASQLPPTFYISNGWFMHHPERFPPPPNLRPFYVSLHITSSWALSRESVLHLRECAPIGCRDRHTLELLRKQGIPSYFSGCLTWTLPRPPADRGRDVLFVDVPSKALRKIPHELRLRAKTLTHWCGVGATRDYVKMPDMAAHRLTAALQSVAWKIGRPLRGFLDDGSGKHEDAQQWRLKLAWTLLAKYARAAMVVTSRIHCCFPCLAMNTPVILLQPRSVFSAERYDIDTPFVRPWPERDYDRIDWSPRASDITPHRLFLESLCEEAVRIRGNPLHHLPVEHFYERSGWKGDGVR